MSKKRERTPFPRAKAIEISLVMQANRESWEHELTINELMDRVKHVCPDMTTAIMRGIVRDMNWTYKPAHGQSEIRSAQLAGYNQLRMVAAVLGRVMDELGLNGEDRDRIQAIAGNRSVRQDQDQHEHQDER